MHVRFMVKTYMPSRAFSLLAIAMVRVACASGGSQKVDLTPKTTTSISVSSTAFQAGRAIPVRNSGYGANVSPALTWSTPPSKTRSVVLIVDDPDAPGGTFTHWLLYNLSGETNSLPAGLPKTSQLNQIGSAAQGKNDTGNIGYFGPRPPAGKAHHYHFKVYALDLPLGLNPGASRAQVLRAMSGHVLASGELVGLFQEH